MQSKSWKWYAAVLLFTGFTIGGAQVTIQIGTIPLTLQTLAVYTAGLFLGGVGGFLSQLFYLCIGMFFPVFAADGFGLGYIANRPTSGYLLAFPIVAAVVGHLSRRYTSVFGALVSLEIGSLILFCCGVTWMYVSGLGAASELIVNGWLSVIPADQIKILLAAGLYTCFRKYSRIRFE